MSGNNSVILNKNIIFSFPSPVKKEDFIQKIKEAALNVVKFLKSNGCDNLGHIKFISTTNGEDYLQLSILDMDQLPKVEGMLKKTFDKIKLTLNIIVFGVKKEEISDKINEELTNIENYFQAS